MFELKVERQVQDGSVRLSWCLDPETTKLLKEHANEEPRILFVTTAGSKRSEARVLAPLDGVMQRVPLSYPGSNTILSAIVWRSDGSNALVDTCLAQYRGGYSTDMVSYADKEPIIMTSQFGDNGYLRGVFGPKIEVNMPTGAFAKEPPAWERRWVDWLYKEKALDQCVYRKRRMLAYTAQPFIGLVWLGVRALWLFAVSILAVGFLAVGFYDLAFKYATNDAISELWDLGNISREKNYWRLLWQTFETIILKRDAEALRQRRKQEERERKVRKEAARTARLHQMYESLLCESGAPAPILSPVKRVIFLFWDIKAMFCKPFVG